MKHRAQVLAFTLAAAVSTSSGVGARQAPAVDDAAGGSAALAPTRHPRVPSDPGQLWMAPDKARLAPSTALTQFAAAVKLEVEADYAKALPLLSSPGVQQGPLGAYAAYYTGLAELRLGRAADALQTFRQLRAAGPSGYLVEAAALREAEADETLNDPAAALEIYEQLSRTKTTAPDDVLMRLGRAARAAGDPNRAAEAFLRAYYEFPLSDLSLAASAELELLPNVQPIGPGNNRYKLELGRAERLFGSRRYSQARGGFEAVRGASRGDDRELVTLRIAECDYFLKRPRSARDLVRPYVDHASRQAEALFFHAVSSRDLGDHDEYLKTIDRLASEFPTQSWTEDGLNNLASHYIVQNEDESADETFRRLYAKFPTGHYAERAAWKIGWWAYKNGRYAETARLFERAAGDFPRSDYRPSWLYWAGRANEALKDKAAADARYVLVATDYLNSYYGRLAVQRLDGRAPIRRVVAGTPAAKADTAPKGDEAEQLPPLPPNEATVRALLGLELYDQALDELRYAQRVWGDSPAIEATIGWIHHERGDLRAGINAMKRAYPQYLAAGGEKLPSDLLKVLFPVDYWPLIRRYAVERNLDPFLIAALIAQESTFEADAKSAAKAYGLMQLLPSTGRRYARTLRLKRFSIGLLTTAESNIRMGTAYFADLVRQFGGAHFALASYNAGESRVAKWIVERPGVDRDEFIDDIPFPETQNYVKKILGTAEDYRRLYGAASAGVGDDTLTSAALAASAATAPGAKPASADQAPAKKKSAARPPKPPKKKARTPVRGSSRKQA